MRVRDDFGPDPALAREQMEALQDRIAAEAVFEDDLGFDPEAACGPSLDRASEAHGDPVAVGVDQAFLDDRAVSAVVATRRGSVVERTRGVTDLEIPYIPGLLSFREGGSILAAMETLSVTPDLALFDGNGRIHFREAGLATHMGVALDLPSVGVAKTLLCGRPRGPIDELPEGARVPLVADGDVSAPEGTVIGYAVQTRQYADGGINPVYVSPGHRMSAETAADIVLRCCAGYKLPEPIRLADAHAEDVKADAARE